MTVEDRCYRHYTCDAPGCSREADTEHEPCSHEPFHTFRVDWGHHQRVLVGTFCELHTEQLRASLKLLGLEERLR